MAPKRGKQAARRAREPTCCVPHCEESLGGFPTSPCGHATCAACVVNSLFIAECACAYAIFRCSQCRSRYKMDGGLLKKLFADHVPSHSKTLESVDGSSRYVMAHTPCEHGCYECEESKLTVLEL